MLKIQPQPPSSSSSSTTPQEDHPTRNPQTLTPHLLPVQISYNGPIDNASRYWTPEVNEKGEPVSYFRGRQLTGRRIPVPPNYTGAVLQVTDRTILEASSNTRDCCDVEEENEEDGGEGQDAQEDSVETKIVQSVGTFDEVIVWQHGHSPVEDGEDPYVRGVNEWIGFAEAMHVDQEDDEKGAGKAS